MRLKVILGMSVFPLKPRAKKLLGTLGILLWIVLYALFAMRVALAILPGAGPVATFLYYAIAGTAWIIPVGLTLPWMHREPRRR